MQAARGASGRLMLLRDYIVRIRPVSSRFIGTDAKADKLSWFRGLSEARSKPTREELSDGDRHH